MGEHHFGAGWGRIKADVGERIDEVAVSHGAAFVWLKLPGEGHSYWFGCPCRGTAANAQRERDVWADLEAEGLAGPDGLLPVCFAERP